MAGVVVAGIFGPFPTCKKPRIDELPQKPVIQNPERLIQLPIQEIPGNIEIQKTIYWDAINSVNENYCLK